MRDVPIPLANDPYWEAADKVAPKLMMPYYLLRDGKSYEQISIDLGVPVGTVKSRISRARAAMAKHQPGA